MTSIDQLADRIVDGIRDAFAAPLALIYKGLEPEKAHPSDAAYDLIACTAKDILLVPGERALIPTGTFAAIPKHHVGLVCSRSGLAITKGIAVLNAPGVIDPSYRGEIRVILINHERNVIAKIAPGDRIAQLLILPTGNITFLHSPAMFDALDTTRGERGFGSTGTASPILPSDLKLNCESCGSPECREGCMT